MGIFCPGKTRIHAIFHGCARRSRPGGAASNGSAAPDESIPLPQHPRGGGPTPGENGLPGRGSCSLSIDQWRVERRRRHCRAPRWTIGPKAFGFRGYGKWAKPACRRLVGGKVRFGNVKRVSPLVPGSAIGGVLRGTHWRSSRRRTRQGAPPRKGRAKCGTAHIPTRFAR